MVDPSASATGSIVLLSRDLVKRHEGRIALVLLLLLTIPMLTKIFTSDFGTHIAMGRQIVRTLSIPDKEFLNYPSLGRSNVNGEWGFQAVLYLVFAAGGAYGVSFLCWAIVLGIFWFLYRSALLRGANPLIAVVAIFAFSGFLRIRIQPRPEIFTYLFISLTIYLLSEYFFGKRKKMLFLFPAMILLWANMHPSYLIGFVIFGAFLVDWFARTLWKSELRWDRMREWLVSPAIVGGTAVVLMGINPQGYDAILLPLHVISRGGGGTEGGSNILLSISELTPVWQTGMYGLFKAAAVLAGVSLLLGLFGRRLYVLDLLLFGIAFKGSWSSARAVSMMGLFLSQGVSLHLTGFADRIFQWPLLAERREENERKSRKARERKKSGKRKSTPSGENGPLPSLPSRRRRWMAGSAVAVPILAAMFFGVVKLNFTFSQLEYGIGITEHKFSFRAAEFLRRNPISGNMFNFFDIGGFLDWQLYPEALTFIDGRTYNKNVFMEHQRVTGAFPGWEEVLSKYKVNYAVLKALDSAGAVLPIVPALANHNDWRLVFADGLFVIFVRNVPETAEIIRRHEISKGTLPNHIIWEAYHYTYLGVSPLMAYQTTASMYELMGNRQAAIETLEKALDYEDLPYLRARLMSLRQGLPPPSSPHGTRPPHEPR